MNRVAFRLQFCLDRILLYRPEMVFSFHSEWLINDVGLFPSFTELINTTIIILALEWLWQFKSEIGVGSLFNPQSKVSNGKRANQTKSQCSSSLLDFKYNEEGNNIYMLNNNINESFNGNCLECRWRSNSEIGFNIWLYVYGNAKGCQ